MTSLGPRIAEGRHAEVFLWGETQVIKLFPDQRPRSWVEYEAATARAVHATGLAVSAVGEIVEAEGRFGLVYEPVDGRPMVGHAAPALALRGLLQTQPPTPFDRSAGDAAVDHGRGGHAHLRRHPLAAAMGAIGGREGPALTPPSLSASDLPPKALRRTNRPPDPEIGGPDPSRCCGPG